MSKQIETTVESIDTLSPFQIERTLPVIRKFIKESNIITIENIELDFSSLPESIQPEGLNAQNKQLLQNVIYQLTDPKAPSYPIISEQRQTGTFNTADGNLERMIEHYKLIEAIKEGNEDKIKKWKSRNRREGENFHNPITDKDSLRALKNSLKTDSPFPDRLRMACVPDILNHQQFIIILALLYSLYAKVEDEIQDTSKTEEYKKILERIIKENLERLQEGEQENFPLAE